EQKNVKSEGPAEPSTQAVPGFLLDRSNTNNAKALSTAIKQKRKEKAAKFSVPLPKVRGISEEEVFKVIKTGKKTHKKGWKRMITKPTFGKSCFSYCPFPPLTGLQLEANSPEDPSSTNVSSGLWVSVTRRPTSLTPNWESPSSYLFSASRRIPNHQCSHNLV